MPLAPVSCARILAWAVSLTFHCPEIFSILYVLCVIALVDFAERPSAAGTSLSKRAQRQLRQLSLGLLVRELAVQRAFDHLGSACCLVALLDGRQSVWIRLLPVRSSQTCALHLGILILLQRLQYFSLLLLGFWFSTSIIRDQLLEDKIWFAQIYRWHLLAWSLHLFRLLEKIPFSMSEW